MVWYSIAWFNNQIPCKIKWKFNNANCRFSFSPDFFFEQCRDLCKPYRALQRHGVKLRWPHSLRDDKRQNIFAYNITFGNFLNLQVDSKFAFNIFLTEIIYLKCYLFTLICGFHCILASTRKHKCIAETKNMFFPIELKI